MVTGADLLVAYGARWWYFGTPLECKVVNRLNGPLPLKQGGAVAQSNAVNTSEKDRMQMPDGSCRASRRPMGVKGAALVASENVMSKGADET